MSRLENSFKRFPPKVFPFETLGDIVDDFIFRFGEKGVDKGMRDTVVMYCEEARSLSQAIDRACASRNAEGKMHNHQSRVRYTSRDLLAESLKRVLPRTKIENFDHLYNIVTKYSCWGIGEVTKYDVCTRIAAYMKLPVETLYLHSGVAIGWALLSDKRCPESMKVSRESFPKPLLRLSTDEVEDLLCGYKTFLKPYV